MENNLEIHQKIRTRTFGDGEYPMRPWVQPLSAMYLKEMKGLCGRDTYMLLHTDKIWNQPKCPSRNEWFKNRAYKHILSCPLQHGLLKDIMLYKLSQEQNDKLSMILLTCNLKN